MIRSTGVDAFADQTDGAWIASFGHPIGRPGAIFRTRAGGRGDAWLGTMASCVSSPLRSRWCSSAWPMTKSVPASGWWSAWAAHGAPARSQNWLAAGLEMATTGTDDGSLHYRQHSAHDLERGSRRCRTERPSTVVRALDSDVSPRSGVGLTDAALGALAYLGDVVFDLAGSSSRILGDAWIETSSGSSGLSVSEGS